MNNGKNMPKGLGIADVLAVVFVVLKLVGVINWSWWWVLSPLWISIALIILCAGIMVIAEGDNK